MHDENSLLDSCTKFKQYLDKAIELGQKSICITNHGNTHNWMEKKLLCDEAGIKFIYGVEMYLTEKLFSEDGSKIRDNYHTILIAKNEDGIHEINNLIFLSTDEDHRYYKNRITFDEFLGISDNVIKISACIQSPLYKYMLIAKESGDTDKLNILDKLLKHYDYYEIQYHNFAEQIEYNKYLYDMSIKYKKPLIAGTDTHSLNKYMAECRKILQIGKDTEFSPEDECDMTLKTYDEVIKAFEEQNSLPMDVVISAIENTNIMSDSVSDFQIDKSIKYPLLTDDDEKEMWNVINRKYNEKLRKGIIDDNPEYKENINEEMRVFKKVNMIGFMLGMSNILSWCRENNIPTCPCRGSVGGSTVAYITDIIDVDPVKRHTIFSRFCNEDREEVGDVDVDFYEDQRPLVYNYIINKFGEERTAYILTHGTCVDKGTIDIICKALKKIDERNGNIVRYDLEKAKEIKQEYSDLTEAISATKNSIKKIEEIEDYMSDTSLVNKKEEYEKELKKNKKKFSDFKNTKYSDIFYYFDGIVNTKVSQSQHPAGIVASPIDLKEPYGMFISSSGQKILSINMEEVHECGLVKYDILGLKNIGIIRKTCELIGRKYPLSHELDWEDQDVFKDMITSPVGIFQFEGDYAFGLLKSFIEYRFKNNQIVTIDDMSLVNASLRPSGESYRDRLLNGEINKNPSKIIDDLLASNNGFLVYQEDTIKFLKQICGLSGSEADNVRRAIGRKQVDRLQKALPQILEGYCKMSPQPRDVAEKEAKEFLKIIESSAKYQFGFNHSTGYSMVGYLGAYFRYYYPLEFCTSYLNCAEKDEDIYDGTMLAKSKGFSIKSPKFRVSSADFTCDKATNTIYKGIKSIKDMSSQNGIDLYNLRDKKYDSFVDLIIDLKGTSVKSNQLLTLVKINFFSEFGSVKKLLSIIDCYNEWKGSAGTGRKTIKKSDISLLGLDNMDISKYATDVLQKGNISKTQYSNVDWIGIVKELSNGISDEEYSILQLAKFQYEILGYVDIVDKSLSWNYVLVMQLNTSYSPKFNAYSIGEGRTIEMKIHSKLNKKDKDQKVSFNEIPVKDGEVIYIKSVKRQPRKKKVDDRWEIVPNTYDWWIKDYMKV